MYVTQGDARIGDGKIDTGKKDQRMDDNYPNLLATGKGDMLQVTVKGGLLTYSNVGLEKGAEKVYETGFRFPRMARNCLMKTFRSHRTACSQMARLRFRQR